jgi:DNA-directed RNA polymerase specialized sigma24 family protein
MAVDRLAMRHEWRLLGHAEWARRASTLVANGSADDPQKAAMAVYCAELHAACSETADADRRNSAFVELHRYLYSVARWRYSDVREQAAQDALVQIYQHIQRCRQPIAFLAFALQHLADAARKLRHQNQSEILNNDDSAIELSVGQEDDLVARVIQAEVQQALAHARAELLRTHPRAGHQIASLWLKHIDGLDDPAIAQQLGVSVDMVYVLRSRGRKLLRSSPRWRTLAQEFGLIDDSDEP